MFWTSSDIIIGDNILRSVYSVYDFGDFDASGNMGNPYLKFLSLVDPNAASEEFAAARGSVAHTNISYSPVNAAAASSSSGRTTVSLSDTITDTLNKINTYFPIMLAILGLNALVILLLVTVAFIYLYRRRSASSARNRRTARRLTPMPLGAMSTDTFTPPPHESMQRLSSPHDYEPVSMALTDDTFVPPSPAFRHSGFGKFKGQPFDDRPKSVA
jgi:saccharopepsin